MVVPDDEDDYLSMTFEETPKPSKESSLQRATRLKREALERGHVPSKAELAERERVARETALATELDHSNKGAKMMAKMGFKGGALGRTDDARTQPVEISMKSDRGGIGMDANKKRRVEEAAVEAENGAKRQRLTEAEFRERNRLEREQKRTEGQLWGAMKVLEGFESDASSAAPNGGSPDIADGAALEGGKVTKQRQGLSQVNVLYRPLVKMRLQNERDRKIRHELNNTLSNRDDDDDDEDGRSVFDTRTDELDDADPELDQFEQLSLAERLQKVIDGLRENYSYCFWCKYQYDNKSMDGCPGLTEDEHG